MTINTSEKQGNVGNDYDNILILGAGFHLLHQRIIQRSAKFNLNSVHIFWFLCNLILLCVIWYKIECPVFSNLSINIDLLIFQFQYFIIDLPILLTFPSILTCISCHPVAVEHSWFSLGDSTVKKFHQQPSSLFINMVQSCVACMT